MLRKIFISYSRKDQDLVDPVADELEYLGFDVWKDTKNLQGGADWTEEIVKAISDCDFFLFFKSSNSISSATVQKEVRLAHDKHRKIIPIIIDDTPYSAVLEFYIGNLQYINSTHLDWKLQLLTALGTRPLVQAQSDLKTEEQGDIHQVINRLKNNSGSERDKEVLLKAFANGELSYDEKARNIDTGGNIEGSIIITGDNNVIGLSRQDLKNLTATKPADFEEQRPSVEQAKEQSVRQAKQEGKIPQGRENRPITTGTLDNDSDEFQIQEYIKSKRYYFPKDSTYADERWFEQEVQNSRSKKQATLCVVNGLHGIGKTWLLQYLRSSRSGVKEKFSHWLYSASSIYYVDLGDRNKQANNSFLESSSPETFVKEIRDIIQDFSKITTLLIDNIPGEADDYIKKFEQNILVPHLLENQGTVVMALQEKSWPWEIIPNDSGNIEMKGWDNNSLEEYIKTKQVNNQQIIWYKSKFQDSDNHIPLLIEYVIKLSAPKGIEQYLEDCLTLGNQSNDLLPIFGVLAFTSEPRPNSFYKILNCVLSYENLGFDATELFTILRELRWIDDIEKEDIRLYKWVEPIRTALRLWLEQNEHALYQKALSCM